MTFKGRRCAALFLTGVLAPAGIWAQQLSPTGYTATINTPTAHVLEVGTASFAWTNNNPEAQDPFPGVGSFGSLNLGFGLLPGVELVGRLAYNGDLHCNLYFDSCRSNKRDLSVGGKVQAPLHWLLGDDFWGKPRLAAGFSDYGGAATQFRQRYVVGSLSFGPLDVSAGYGLAVSRRALLDGAFGSASLRLIDGLAVHLESGAKPTRAGLSYSRSLAQSGFGRNLDVTVAASRRLQKDGPDQAYQFTFGLTYHFDRKGQDTGYGSWPADRISAAAAPMPLASTVVAPPIPPSPTPASPLDHGAQAQQIADLLVRYGMSDVSVGRTPSGWWIAFEPLSWRKNRLDALAAGLAALNQAGIDPDETLALRLTYLGQPVLGVRTSVFCMRAFALGPGLCRQAEPIAFFNDAEPIDGLTEPTAWLVRSAGSSRFKPQIELSPAASYTFGTEFGIYDFSVGLTTGWEIPLAKGLLWQGYVTSKFYDTDDFADRRTYFRRIGLGERSQLGANQITAIWPLGERAWGQLVVGALGPQTKGSQLDFVWQSPRGHWRFWALEGAWDTGLPEKNRPRIFSLRYAVVPGLWNLEFSQGKFFNNDRGFRWESAHVFGDHRVRFYWRKTGPGNRRVPNRFEFIGFSVTMPIGPRESADYGSFTLRGRDQYAIGLETKVAEKDNYIELGYGIFPFARHGLMSDVIDYDRTGLDALEANRYRLRASLREHLLNPR